MDIFKITFFHQILIMKNSSQESLIELNEIEEVQQYGGGSINDEEEFEEDKKIIEEKDNVQEKKISLIQSDKPKEDEKSYLISNKNRELNEKEDLYNVLVDVAKTLKTGKNINRSMSEIFVNIELKDIVTKSEIIEKKKEKNFLNGCYSFLSH